MEKIRIISFGFKYGKPPANYIFDVSFLKNPKSMTKWTENIWRLTPEMRQYVLDQEKTQKFLKLVVPFIVYVSQQTDCVIGIGCTGGHHRSVAIADEIAKHLIEMGIDVEIIHRNKLDG